MAWQGMVRLHPGDVHNFRCRLPLGKANRLLWDHFVVNVTKLLQYLVGAEVVAQKLLEVTPQADWGPNPNLIARVVKHRPVMKVVAVSISFLLGTGSLSN